MCSQLDAPLGKGREVREAATQLPLQILQLPTQRVKDQIPALPGDRTFRLGGCILQLLPKMT
jgi:hypothetical protein